MRILKAKDKEITINATLKKIALITRKNKGSNLKDTFFKALNSVDYIYLANLILDLSENEDGKKAFNGDINQVYDFMEAWVETNNSDYEALFKEVAEEINVKSFFGKKMSKEELETMMTDPLASFDISKVIENTAQNVIGEAVAEEFRGYKG